MLSDSGRNLDVVCQSRNTQVEQIEQGIMQANLVQYMMHWELEGKTVGSDLERVCQGYRVAKGWLSYKMLMNMDV